MYSALTQNIRVTVRPEFSPERSEPSDGAYFWIYSIEIANQGQRRVKLMQRHWRITDALGHLETVDGPGVVGEQPTIAPGHAFRYSSGCPLRTPSGFMVGTYSMVDEEGRTFDVEIPAFSLDSPFLRKVLN
jgi:ApaG protein